MGEGARARNGDCAGMIPMAESPLADAAWQVFTKVDNIPWTQGRSTAECARRAPHEPSRRGPIPASQEAMMNRFRLWRN
jgi:hypothetical protein